MAGERAQQAQDAVGIDAGRVDEEGHHHDDDPQRQHAALGERLGADVERAEHRELPAADQDRVAALRGDPVDGDDQDPERGPPPQRPERALACAGGEARRATTAAPAPARTIGFEKAKATTANEVR